jgi:hypothetical protein
VAYATPTCPAETEAVVICTGIGAVPTVSENVFVADCAGVAESVTFAMKLNVPVAVGVPEIVPVAADSVKPAGSAPELRLQL